MDATLLTVGTLAEIETARRAAVRLAAEAGFTTVGQARIALLVSELGANLVRHAGHGTLALAPTTCGVQRGIAIEASDNGPGIADIGRAMMAGYSTAGGLGHGLAVIRNHADELSITSTPKGTIVRAVQWTN